jgi:hypothetical protein
VTSFVAILAHYPLSTIHFPLSTFLLVPDGNGDWHRLSVHGLAVSLKTFGPRDIQLERFGE